MLAGPRSRLRWASRCACRWPPVAQSASTWLVTRGRSPHGAEGGAGGVPLSELAPECAGFAHRRPRRHAWGHLSSFEEPCAGLNCGHEPDQIRAAPISNPGRFSTSAESGGRACLMVGSAGDRRRRRQDRPALRPVRSSPYGGPLSVGPADPDRAVPERGPSSFETNELATAPRIVATQEARAAVAGRAGWRARRELGNATRFPHCSGGPMRPDDKRTARLRASFCRHRRVRPRGRHDDDAQRRTDIVPATFIVTRAPGGGRRTIACPRAAARSSATCHRAASAPVAGQIVVRVRRWPEPGQNQIVLNRGPTTTWNRGRLCHNGAT